MGYINPSTIRAAVRYVLRSLSDWGGTISYGEAFYDGTDETHRKVSEAMQLEFDHVAEHAVNVAVYELKELRLVV